MEGLITLFLFAFGLVIGSFLNVVILRYNTGKSIKGRSACFSCGSTLKWHHLIPLVSFLALRGRCAFCGSKISWQYPLVELATALLFLLAWIFVFPHYSLLTPHYALSFVILMVTTCLLVVIFVYDLRHKIIPDGIVFSLIGLGFITLMLRHSLPFNRSGASVDFLSALIIFLFFFSLWYFSRGTWMGLGDAKLAIGMSLFLPWAQNLSAIILSFWIGAAFGLLLMTYERMHKAVLCMRVHKTALCIPQHSMSSELPFAPFMILAFFIVLFFQFDLVSWLVL